MIKNRKDIAFDIQADRSRYRLSCVLGAKGSNENRPEVRADVELCIGGKIIGKV